SALPCRRARRAAGPTATSRDASLPPTSVLGPAPGGARCAAGERILPTERPSPRPLSQRWERGVTYGSRQRVGVSGTRVRDTRRGIIAFALVTGARRHCNRT